MILERILAATRRTVTRAKAERPRADVERAARAMPAARGFAAGLRRPGRVACIAEIKRRSPSAGWIRKAADAAAVAASYERAGAAAVSVLTDGPFFDGSLQDLTAARAAIGLAVLRKDFCVDPYQVVEARAAGADAVLLIAAALPDGELAALLGEAAAWGLDALVEVHDEAETDRALEHGALLVGINHRDLRTFEMDMTLATRLRRRISSDCVVVAESGIRTPDDVRRMQEAGVEAVLVGEALMRAPDPEAALRTLLGAP